MQAWYGAGVQVQVDEANSDTQEQQLQLPRSTRGCDKAREESEKRGRGRRRGERGGRGGGRGGGVYLRGGFQEGKGYASYPFQESLVLKRGV